ncbi:hypothetical protein AMS68_001218 [Peltaster fructicola]|uniref:Uncharacterized protein n=1 Tax=Peltaster fructicola TaxID=286661 RepID=A0A6H0XM35_9PEZI|nr:hypothetical protein AMS68_001218 [Peltaster fructicola]
MATGQGMSIQDMLPIPDTNTIANADQIERSHALGQEATASHALAVADHDEKGAAQQDHDAEVQDLGWNEPKEKVAQPLVGGMDNEELWLLVRRFNKQMYHVKEYPYPLPNNLDLNIADEEEFSPDKLRASIERLYMTVGVGVLGAVKQIARLRSWKETKRTSCFAAAYFIAWIFDILAPLFLVTLIALIAYPPSRSILFPPAPLALVSSKTGGVQKPKAGVLGSHDSATGAPENFKGEAVEAEASNFVNSITNIAMSSASGKHPQSEPPSATAGGSVPDPTAVTLSASDARSKAAGGPTKHDKTKVPMETAMWNKMRPIMHGLADVSDTWERFGNALDPTPPFPKDVFRLRLAALVVPLLAASIFTTNYMLVKGITFGVGFGFFSDPLMAPALKWLNTNFPHWQKLLEIRNTILKGVPTNAQLTITLLRVGEANKAPLPPPPFIDAPPPDVPADLTDEHLIAAGGDAPLNASEAEIRAAIEHDPTEKHRAIGHDVAKSKDAQPEKKTSKLLGALKGSVKGAISTALGADHLKAKVGSTHAKQRLGVVPSDPQSQLSGPVEFRCRFQGKRGHAYISTKATIPCVSFSIDKTINKVGTLDRDDEELHPVWSVAVADIKELKKVGGLGWKAKLIVGWAMDREVADGLEITDKQGNKFLVTAMVLRDELFNRLVAMGGQKWESW